MIHTTKNIKWVIATTLVCILFGLLTFYTFIGKSFIELNSFNLQLLLLTDAILLALFFGLIVYEGYKVLKKRKRGKLGSETTLRYFIFFSTTTLLPSILIALFSLTLFNVGLQKFFNKKIKTIVNNSAEVAKSYVQQNIDSIEADILLVVLDINNKSNMYYDNPKKFLNILATQRMLRRLDEIHLLDSSGNLIMSNIVDTSLNFVPPPAEAFTQSLSGRPVRITDPARSRTSALIKLNNFIDTYLYVIKFINPQLINYIKESNQAVSFYYTVRQQKNEIKITFAVIYLLVVSLLLFVSIIISINFASRLTQPIINLIGASEKISSGDLNAKVPKIESDKEIEKLNENFNSMIDKLKKQQDKLLMSERHEAWENVARKLAHEIKNPLTPIQLSIDRIKDKYLNKVEDKDKNFSNYLNTIAKQIKDIEHLITEFSDFARMPKPILKKINLNKVVSRSLNLLKLSEKTISFDFTEQKSKFLIKGDEEQINRVFINLIKNSIESIQEKKRKNVGFKGKINVDIKADSDYIYVTIKDNGIGFDEANKTKMLTPYFTTKVKGTGLGLSIVTKIINDHNSSIIFNSIKGGAKVEISMPKYYD